MLPKLKLLFVFITVSFQIAAAQNSFTSQLPILKINTNNQLIIDEPKIHVDMGIIYMGDSINQSSGVFNHFKGFAGNNHEKEYIVTVDQPITEGFIKMMSNGIPILDTVTQKCFVEQLDKHRFRIILTQGLNRQIRRMCIYLGYQVKKLKRIRIMNIKLADLPPGKWRNFTQEEIDLVNELIADSSKTA